ncbi:MAG TPA: MMPL family transporter [Solirubrobacteraceae bacterium]|nr:MMPL family transporter [Solirubrobacteraceae bacterium]
MNIAERAGRWSAAHWKTATFGWLALVICAVAIGQLVGTVKLSNSEQSIGQSARAQAMLNRAGFHDHASESVLVQSASLTAAAPSFRAEVDRVVARIGALREVQGIRSPLQAGNGGQISKDGHSALIEFDMRGSSDTASDRVQPVLNTAAALQRRAPHFTVAEFGDASSNLELNKVVNDGLSRAERLSLPITFAVLLIAFGAFVAAGLPVLLAFSAVLGSGGLAALASHIVHASDATSSVMLLMGMAVGVDYSLFYLKREREERSVGHDDALHRAAATSGRAVLASGITVLIAMAGMLLSGSKVFDSIGIGAMLVVFLAMIGSLTVLPALLGRLGDKIDRGRIRRPRGESRVWNAVLRPVLRFPAFAALLSTLVLVVLAVPMLGMHTTMLGPSDMPRSIPVIKTYQRIQKAFPGAQMPAQVVLRAANVDSPQVRGAISRLERLALASGQAKKPFETQVNADHTVVRIQVPLVGTGQNTASMAALETLRSKILPASIGRLPGATYAVTGETAGTEDFNSAIKHSFPLVFAFVLGLAFLLLLITFRSLVIPLTSIVLNLLSVGAAYGVLVWIFQDGHLQGLLGFHSDGAVITWLPLFLFAVLFGLSMDYHVFIVSRIKELRDDGFSTSEAVTRGIRGTASTVTAAAVVMVAVFAIFASLPTLDIKQLGVGLAIAVLLDATLIRGVLLPAAMKMLGEWNWYLPRWLDWLPRVRLDASPVKPAAEAA